MKIFSRGSFCILLLIATSLQGAERPQKSCCSIIKRMFGTCWGRTTKCCSEHKKEIMMTSAVTCLVVAYFINNYLQQYTQTLTQTYLQTSINKLEADLHVLQCIKDKHFDINEVFSKVSEIGNQYLRCLRNISPQDIAANINNFINACHDKLGNDIQLYREGFRQQVDECLKQFNTPN